MGLLLYSMSAELKKSYDKELDKLLKYNELRERNVDSGAMQSLAITAMENVMMNIFQVEGFTSKYSRSQLSRLEDQFEDKLVIYRNSRVKAIVDREQDEEKKLRKKEARKEKKRLEKLRKDAEIHSRAKVLIITRARARDFDNGLDPLYWEYPIEGRYYTEVCPYYNTFENDEYQGDGREYRTPTMPFDPSHELESNPRAEYTGDGDPWVEKLRKRHRKPTKINEMQTLKYKLAMAKLEVEQLEEKIKKMRKDGYMCNVFEYLDDINARTTYDDAICIQGSVMEYCDVNDIFYEFGEYTEFYWVAIKHVVDDGYSE